MDYEQYLEKVSLAKKYVKAYYVDDKPLASDEEYDKLLRELKDFESKNESLISKDSPTQYIGSVIQSEFKKIRHLKKMWSMEDVFDEEELRAWAKRARCEKGFFVEAKFDGASLNLLYEDGKLISGATRGDGEVGEDISLNVLEIDNIPKTIAYKGKIEIRGEVLILKDDFEALNESRAKEAQSLFANPRNAASGSLRQLDTSITRARKLKFYPWGVGEHSRLCENLDEVLKAYKELLALRDKKPMMMDGMVVRIDDLALCESLSYTVKFPRFMAAFKFPALEKSTKLLGVNLQVGRSGLVTPVAVLEPVELDGVRVSSASLHNFDEIARLDIRINDYVAVIRSGDVIPKITNVYKDRREGKELLISRPKLCPVCESELLDEGILIRCQNLNCEARLVNSIIYFVSKKCMNIDGLGESIVELLYKHKKISSIESIYSLKYSDFEGLEGFKDKKINNLLSSIEASKDNELFKFISALGIEHIGEVAAKKIASSFSFEWLDKKKEDFEKLEGFGEQMALSLEDFLAINKERILHFYSILRLKNTQQESKTSSFTAKIVVITGSLSKPRDEFKALLESMGAKVSSSISAKTDFLLCGKDAGSKLEKAKALGIKILSEEEFNSLLV